MNDAVASPTPSRPLRWALAVLVLVLLLGAAGWCVYRWNQLQQQQRLQAQTEAVQLQGLVDSVEALRRDQRATSQRVQDAATTNRVLRDEVLGLGQRNALLEENLAKLADSTRQQSHVLHRDEAELLLTQASQRLQGAGDVEGARRLYALAATALADLPPQQAMNLRQALIQERAAVDALGEGPRAQVLQRLAAFSQALDALPVQVQAASTDQPQPRSWWRVALAPFVEITPTRLQGPLTDAERVAGRDALLLEVTLARAAIERGDAAALQQAAEQIDRWMRRLWPDSPALRSQRAELQSLRSAPLRPDAPELGSTLQLLRTLHDGETP